MNEDDDFLENLNIDEEIDFDEEFTTFQTKENKYTFQKIRDICLANPLYQRRQFKSDDANILNICYDCKDFQIINAMLNKRIARRKY